MRRIDIPNEALDRHEKTLGEAILSFLNRLAAGNSVTWEVHAGGGKTHDQVRQEHDKIINDARDKQCIEYWKWLRDEFSGHHILTAKPARLIIFARENAEQLSALTNGRKAIDEICGRLFKYSAFRNGEVLLAAQGAGRILWVGRGVTDDENRRRELAKWRNWSIAEFVRMLDVRYCPYCNAETVGTAHLPSSEHVPDIDHILPKSSYPLLSLSLYNLVPACNRCNSRFKKDDDLFKGWSGHGDLPALHPYVHHVYKHMRFDYNPTSVSNLYLKPHSSNTTYISPLTVSAVKSSVTREKRAEDYIARYHLKKIYDDVYSEEINESIRMEALCSPHFVETMRHLYGVAENDLDRMFRRTSLDPHDINHYRFAKLIGDLHDTICFDVSDEKKKRIIKRLEERFGLK